MATTIRRLDAAFASTVVAVYEPLIVRWVSGKGMNRFVTSMHKSLRKKTISATGNIRMLSAPLERAGDADSPQVLKAYQSVRKLFPDARMHGHAIYLDGNQPNVGGGAQTAEPGPLMLNGLTVQDEGDLVTREVLQEKLGKVIQTAFAETLERFKVLPSSELRNQIMQAVHIGTQGTQYELDNDLLAIEGEMLEYLSPIGVAHYFRQIYFSTGEGVGPIEQAFSVAPKETLELVVETIRTQIHEEVTEYGSETMSEAASESRDINEVSDKVASMLKRDTSMAVSASVNASAQGGTAFFWASGSVNFGLNSNLASSSQQAREIASRRLKEVTKRASERITRTFKSRVSDSVSVTSSNTMRRVISNSGATPVSYGLRRVYNKLRIQVQALGPRLVWQVYVPRPGAELAQSRFMYFAETQALTTQNAPPATRPAPVGDTDRGNVVAAITYSTVSLSHSISFNISPPPGRKITSVSIENMTDIEYPDAERKTAPTGIPSVAMIAGRSALVSVPVRKAQSESVRIDYSYSWEPSDDVMNAWKAEVESANQALKSQEADARSKFLREDFERQRQLLVSKSKVRARPGDDLRKEERYEILNALIRELFQAQKTGNDISPLQIELFHRYFDVESLFYFVHPSWWRPRYRAVAGAGRPSYEVAAETEPAPMGSSLGWVLQLDGDTRRNEFINSPWVRVCIPIAPNREREALAWLAEHIEGKMGYDAGAEPLAGLLAEIEKFRQQEAAAGSDGAEYATFGAGAHPVSASTGATTTPTVPPGASVYPVIATFDVASPTEGFVYDEITVQP